MKIKYLLPGLASLLIANQAIAATQDYKCYAQLYDKSFEIAFVDGANISSASQAAQVLLSQGFYAEDGKTLLKVKKVIECQKMMSSFINVKANQADERTPR